MLLSKLVACKSSCNVQIVAMSATMTGLDSLSAWLGAHLFLTNFRPVPLTEHAVFGGVVYAKADKPAGEYCSSQSSCKQQAEQLPTATSTAAVLSNVIHMSCNVKYCIVCDADLMPMTAALQALRACQPAIEVGSGPAASAPLTCTASLNNVAQLLPAGDGADSSEWPLVEQRR
jgi:hypothetical protein